MCANNLVFALEFLPFLPLWVDVIPWEMVADAANDDDAAFASGVAIHRSTDDNKSNRRCGWILLYFQAIIYRTGKKENPISKCDEMQNMTIVGIAGRSPTHTHTNSQLTSKWLKCVSKNTTQLLRASIENCWNYTTKRNSIEMCAAVGCCRVYLTRLYNNKYICMYIFFALNHSRTLFVYEITHTHCSARNWENEIKIQRKRNSIEDRKKKSLSFRTTNWMVKIVGVHRRSTTTRENRCSYVNYSRVCVGGESKRECGSDYANDTISVVWKNL